MKELTEYYKKNICPFCKYFETKECLEEIEEMQTDESKNVSCKNYYVDKKEVCEVKKKYIYTLPKKYYSRNLKEV